jgi:hypothetical protein
VTGAPANLPPQISGTPPATIAAGTAYSFAPTAVDPDGQTLSFFVFNKPDWMVYDDTTGRLGGTPTLADLGTRTKMQIGVTDGIAVVWTRDFSITVFDPATTTPAPSTPTTPSTPSTPSTPTTPGTPSTPSVPAPPAVNQPPSISGAPATSVTAGSNYSFRPGASDPEGNTLAFSVTGKPAWASFSASTGALTGTASAGTYPGIVISVSDGSLSASLAPFSITVNAPPNAAPVISGTPLSSVVAGSAYSFVPVATDADGNTLGFSIAGKPSWATFNTATGALTGTPTAAQIGIYSSIVITASDGTKSAALPAFTITVAAAPTPPPNTGSALLNWTAPTQNTDGSALTNLAGFNIYHGTSANSLSRTAQVGAGTTSYTYGSLASGTHYFSVSAYNNQGVESALSGVGSKTIP